MKSGFRVLVLHGTSSPKGFHGDLSSRSFIILLIKGLCACFEIPSGVCLPKCMNVRDCVCVFVCVVLQTEGGKEGEKETGGQKERGGDERKIDERERERVREIRDERRRERE